MKNQAHSARRGCFIIAVAVAILLFPGNSTFAQTVTAPQVIVPKSSMERPEDVGKCAHTNVRWIDPTEVEGNYMGETPGSLSCIYKLVNSKLTVKGCSPDSNFFTLLGGSKTIAIVDAYDAPNAASDLAYFASYLGLPTPAFDVVYASGSKPAYDAGWEMEESLDVQWAYAMAPYAHIYLVEAASNSYADLMAAVEKANQLVAAAGGGEVSMSWGGSEWSSEAGYDSYFQTPGVVYFAATGDGPGTSYPAVSPYVVAVGGTTLRTNPNAYDKYGHNSLFMKECAWVDTGGGVSLYEPRPSYQNGIAKTVGSARGVPDISAVADPYTGVWVYISGQGGWWIVGGTSAATPIAAGIVNAAGSFYNNTAAELKEVYTKKAFQGITYGFCGPAMGYQATGGWNFCTGVGSPKSEKNK